MLQRVVEKSLRLLTAGGVSGSNVIMFGTAHLMLHDTRRTNYLSMQISFLSPPTQIS
jgi:hypothetical protein